MPICSIEKGVWDFPLFQIGFLNSMISLCIYCLSIGYRPLVNFVNKEGVNLWEQFLKQPFEDVCLPKRNVEQVLDISEAFFKISILPSKQ